MAIHGVNLAEKLAFVLPEDPGHPDEINHLIDKAEDEEIASGKRKTSFGTDKRAEMFEAYTAANKPTTYMVGNLTSADRIELGDMGATPTMKDSGITMTMRNVQRAYEVVQRGLKGWDNQLDFNGVMVPFITETIRTGGGEFQEAVASSCMVHLPQSVIMSLSTEILRKNGMTAELEKNSEGASLPLTDLNSKIGGAVNAQPTSKANADATNPQKEK